MSSLLQRHKPERGVWQVQHFCMQWPVDAVSCTNVLDGCSLRVIRGPFTYPYTYIDQPPAQAS